MDSDAKLKTFQLMLIILFHLLTNYRQLLFIVFSHDIFLEGKNIGQCLELQHRSVNIS